MRFNTLSILWISGVLAAPLCLAQHTAALEGKLARTAKTDPFLTGAPFTLDQTLSLLKQDAIPLRRRKEAIRNRGVDFYLSAENLDKLKATAAPSELLDLVHSKAKPVPPPTASPKPAPTPKGGIRVECAPAECSVAANGKPLGETLGGSLELAALSPGKWIIDFSKSGYIARQRSVLVEENKTAAVSAVLDPDRATEEALGAQLLQKIIAALGGDEGIQDVASLEAIGSATVQTRQGAAIRWSLRMRNHGIRSLFQVKAGRVTHEVMFTGSEFTASKSLKGQDALELPADFGYIRDNQLAALITRLQKPRYKLLAKQTEPAAGEDFILVAEGGTDKISVGLNSDLRPVRAHIETETGIGSLLLTYSDYMQTGRAWYPKNMQAKPDGQPNGIQVRFDTVELNPKLKESDMKLKGGIFSNFYN